MKHGTIGAYSNHHCRCDLCTKAHAVYFAEYRKKKLANPPDKGQCRFLGCEEKIHPMIADFCGHHNTMLRHLVRKGTRTWEEIYRYALKE